MAQNISDKSEFGRSYPSIFQAWNSIENLPNESEMQRLARHDLAFGHPYTLLRINWDISESQPYAGLSTELSSNQLTAAHQRKQELLSINPHILLLVEIRYRDAKYLSARNETLVDNWWDVGYYPPDSPYWLKNKDGKPVIGWGEDTNGDLKIDEDDIVLNYLIDFTNPNVQALIVKQTVALSQSGLFDGIMLDWWNEDSATTPINVDDWSDTILTSNAELEARLSILHKIRERVDNDFLILVNANTRQVPKSAPYINGLFMECYKQDYTKGYNLNQIKQMEKTLLWAEEHLRSPRINCLEGWRMVTDYMVDQSVRIKERNSDTNLQWMRMITAMSLTHSDGYVLFADDNAMPSPDHLHNWYDFWDVDLGQPIQEKAIEYKGVTGLFIREFQNGWVVYNRNNTIKQVSFDVQVKGVYSEELRQDHRIAAFDGEIFMKQNNGEVTVNTPDIDDTRTQEFVKNDESKELSRVEVQTSWTYRTKENQPTEGDRLVLEATVIGNFNVKNVRFLYNSTSELGIDNKSPFTWELDSVPPGNYKLHAEAIDTNGVVLKSDTLNVVIRHRDGSLPEEEESDSDTFEPVLSLEPLPTKPSVLSNFVPYKHEGIVGAPETLTRILKVRGVARKYLLHIPGELKRLPTEMPLVINMHGWGSTAENQQTWSRFDEVADRYGILVVYPEATQDSGRLWLLHEEITFFEALFDELYSEFEYDKQRVYATGFSAGGFMACFLASGNFGKKIAAIAPVSGHAPLQSMNPDWQKLMDPGTGMPVLFIMNIQDGLSAGIPESVDLFLKWNIGKRPPQRHLFTNDPIPVVEEHYPGGKKADVFVLLFDFVHPEIGTHFWPWEAQGLETSEIIWKFFSNYKR